MISAKECFLVFLSLINMLLPRQVMIYACCGRLEPQHSTLLIARLCRKKEGWILCTCTNESNVTIVTYAREWQAHKAIFTYYYESTDTDKTHQCFFFFFWKPYIAKYSCFLLWHNIMLKYILFYLCGCPIQNNMKWRENDMRFSNFRIFRWRCSMTLIRLKSE